MEEKLKYLEEMRNALTRYKRLSESNDFLETIEEVDAFFKLGEPSFGLLIHTSPNASKAWDVREGARAYAQHLKDLVKITEKSIKLLEEQMEEERKQKEVEENE